MDLFRETFGIGEKGQINFYKYSPQKECFIGFDQAYVKTQIEEEQFFNILKKSASNDSYVLKDSFVGYFLQYKVVMRMKNMGGITPSCINSSPHYRAKLNTTKNPKTGFSQHELLWNLKKNPGAMVYYACPMIFDKEDLYDIRVDLDNLRLADVNSCPSAYQDNKKHYIYFNKTDSDPFWCSEPTEGTAITPRNFAELLKDAVSEKRARESVYSLMRSIEIIRKRSLESEKFLSDEEDVGDGKALEDLLTIARVTRVT